VGGTARPRLRRDRRKKGHRWRGVNTLLLTTCGRRSGKLRRTALIYGEDGDRYAVVASNGGAKKHTSWYLNWNGDGRFPGPDGPSEEVSSDDRFAYDEDIAAALEWLRDETPK
jgi:deazaflavin-dependent oxidoreductase (nitroreductase family)